MRYPDCQTILAGWVLETFNCPAVTVAAPLPTSQHQRLIRTPQRLGNASKFNNAPVATSTRRCRRPNKKRDHKVGDEAETAAQAVVRADDHAHCEIKPDVFVANLPLTLASDTGVGPKRTRLVRHNLNLLENLWRLRQLLELSTFARWLGAYDQPIDAFNDSLE